MSLPEEQASAQLIIERCVPSWGLCWLRACNGITLHGLQLLGWQFHWVVMSSWICPVGLGAFDIGAAHSKLLAWKIGR
jgi:hypothetical protein